MGCGSSTTPSVVDDLNGATATTKTRVPAARPRHTPDHRTGHHSAGGGEDLPTELLPESVPAAPIKPPLAFEILLDADKEAADGSGLVKMHPPRPPPRLQRGQLSDTPLTLEELQEKMESAERRRQTILQNRIASANKSSRQATRSVMEKQETIEYREGENEDDSPHMKTVEELKNTINLEDHSVTLPP